MPYRFGHDVLSHKSNCCLLSIVAAMTVAARRSAQASNVMEDEDGVLDLNDCFYFVQGG